MKTIVLCNGKSAIGRTWLLYHLTWIFADLECSVLAVDLDPQADLTARFLDEDRLEELWLESPKPRTISGVVERMLNEEAEALCPCVEEISDNIGLLPGDLSLSLLEDAFSDAWSRCREGDEKAFRVVSIFRRIIEKAGAGRNAEIALIDVGANSGAINKAAILAADRVVIPLTTDLFSLQGLKNFGLGLRKWRRQWDGCLAKRPNDREFQAGAVRPVGYVVLQRSVRLDRPVQAYQRWLARVPEAYRRFVLGETAPACDPDEPDPNEIGQLKDYRSLMPMAMEARKPIFHLLPADGAIGSHLDAVRRCRKDFAALAREIAKRCGIETPEIV